MGRGMKKTLLLVDDSDLDAECLRRSLKRAGLRNPFRWAIDGQAAIDLLEGRGPEKAPEEPFLVLLDLNMPRLNGIEFLERVQKDPDLCPAPIYVLSTSTLPGDIAEARAKGAAGYFVKPIGADELAGLLE